VRDERERRLALRERHLEAEAAVGGERRGRPVHLDRGQGAEAGESPA
jgi:hypothetical protein